MMDVALFRGMHFVEGGQQKFAGRSDSPQGV